MEQFVNLQTCLKLCIKSNVYKCTLQDRCSKYKFGTNNYGEIIGLKNRADGDRWDIFAPGYFGKLKTNSPFLIKSVIGVYKLENGNHKIAVRLYKSGFCETYCNREIQRFCSTYTNGTKVKGVWVPFK